MFLRLVQFREIYIERCYNERQLMSQLAYRTHTLNGDFKMKTSYIKTLLSVFSVLVASSCLAQEVIVETDYSAARAYDSSYAFAGYGLDGDEESVEASDSMSVKNAESKDGGNDGKCLTATLDASKSTVPEFPAWDYAGVAVGSGLDLAAAFKDTDLSQYEFSFDAKVTGCETLESSKCFLRFVLPDDTMKKDEDDEHDVVLSLARGEEDGTDTFEITNEYKTFSFNLKDMDAQAGSADDLAKHDVKQISFMVQAQGTASDFGKDADNVLYIDNVKLVKKAKEAAKEEKKAEATK